MEGTGPSRGNPKKTNLILVGTNPYFVDMIASKIAGYPQFIEIPTLNVCCFGFDLQLPARDGLLKLFGINEIRALLPETMK